MKLQAQTLSSLGEISKKKLLDIRKHSQLPPFYKAINNVNFQKKYKFDFFFFTMDDILVWKVAIYVSWKKIHFPKIKEQAT